MKLNSNDINRICKEVEDLQVMATIRHFAKLGDEHAQEYLNDRYEEQYIENRRIERW